MGLDGRAPAWHAETLGSVPSAGGHCRISSSHDNYCCARSRSDVNSCCLFRESVAVNVPEGSCKN